MLPAQESFAWHNLGVISWRLGRFNEALQCYKKALELNPSDELIQTNITNLEAYLSANPSLRNQSQQTPPESGKNFLQTLLGALQGAFNEDQTGEEAIVDFLIGLIPIIGQVADARDLAAYLYRIVFKGQVGEVWNWIGLALTLVGIVPVVGDTAKFLGKTSVRKGVSELAENLGDVLNRIRISNPEVADNIPQLKAVLAQNWHKGTQAALDRWNTVLSQLSNWANSIPDLLFSRQKRQLIKAIDDVKKQSDKMLSQAFEEIRQKIDEALDAIGRLLNPQGDLVTLEGVKVPSDKVDEATQGPLRMEGGTGGSGLKPSVARFLNLEEGIQLNLDEIKKLGEVYKEALDQNRDTLAKEFARINSKAQTATENRARALANNDEKNLRQAEKLSRDVAADSARLERKLVERGIFRNRVHYRPEPDLLGNNLHGLDWEGKPRRLAKKKIPQGRFGSLADIQFAVDRAAELGVG